MKYLLIMQTQNGQKQIVFEEPQSDFRIFFKGILKLTKMLFML